MNTDFSVPAGRARPAFTLIGIGVSNVWFPWPDSTTTNQVTIPIAPANPPVFLRLVYPPQ